MLNVLEHLPDGFLEAKACELHTILSGPTLIHLAGRRPQPLFASILLHGDEDVGLCAVQNLLRQHAQGDFPRAFSLFVGNVAAARHGVRRLDGQPDYNRIWPGTEDPESVESRMMADIVDQMRRRRVFASIDLHNNTGVNPHYCCVNVIANPHLQLASLFSRTVVYFLRPKGVQSMAFAAICPAVTCECGKVGDATGVVRAFELLNACLHLVEIPSDSVPQGDIHLYHTIATVKVPSGATIGFGNEPADFRFLADLERLNFLELSPGTQIGFRAAGMRDELEIWDENGNEVRRQFVGYESGAIRLRRSVIPSMLTQNERVIRQDCLGYLMEPLDR
jgi:succinylglutamate desuccinylase